MASHTGGAEFENLVTTDTAQVTVFDSVGFALEDYAALRYLHELALQLGVGTDVALVPPPADDPKDLFRHTHTPAGRPTLRRVA